MGLGLRNAGSRAEDELSARWPTAGWAATAALLLPQLAAPVAGVAGIASPLRFGFVPGLVSAAGFALVGLYLGTTTGDTPRHRRWGAAYGYAVAGLLVPSAYGSLSGLTGREPVLLVTGVVAGAFALGFAAIGLGVAQMQGLPARAAAKVGGRSAMAGALGGGIALAPFLFSALGLHEAGPFVRVPLALAASLGCLTVPSFVLGTFRWSPRDRDAT